MGPFGPLYTRKFSEFNASTVQDGVGLNAGGVNAISPNTGGGGSGDIITTISQDTTGLSVGDWVRVNGAGLYVPAQANTPENSDVKGVVREIITVGVNGQFRLQQAGYIPSGTPGFSGFLVNQTYYLSDTTQGTMTQTEPTLNGSISQPVFGADSADSGWVICLERGHVIGYPGPIPSGGGGGGTDTNVQVISQPGNTFAVGDWVRVSGEKTYTKAQGNTLANAQGVGVVTVSGNPNFTIQFAGYNSNTVTQAVDAAGAPIAITASTVYYLSDIVAGKITPTPPTDPMKASKPCFISSSVADTTGWVLPQRPLPAALGIPGASPYVYLGVLNAATNFQSTNILLDANGNTFKAYQIIIHAGSNVAINYGIRFTSASAQAIGIQFYDGTLGAWSTTPGTYANYIMGVNSTAGINTATLYGSVNNSGLGIATTMGLISPSISTNVGLIGGSGILTIDPNAAVLSGTFIVTNLAAAPLIGYTSNGWAGGSAPNTTTGFRLVSTTGVFDPASLGYVSVFGIPGI